MPDIALTLEEECPIVCIDDLLLRREQRRHHQGQVGFAVAQIVGIDFRICVFTAIILIPICAFPPTYTLVYL